VAIILVAIILVVIIGYYKLKYKYWWLLLDILGYIIIGYW